MSKIIPKKLRVGDTVRVVAPSRSNKIISEETRSIAIERFKEMGLKLTFAKNTELMDGFCSSPAELRAADIMEAFVDPEIAAIFTAIGGFNSIDVLPHLDYNVIRANPKILCGYSDISVLVNAVHTATDIVTYYGPHYSTLGMAQGCEYTLDYLERFLFCTSSVEIRPSVKWSDDLWFLDQNNRAFISNPGWEIIQEGDACGEVIAGNLNAIRLLHGTRFSPNYDSKILFLENDELDGDFTDREFDRRLSNIFMQKGCDKILALVIGRFQKKSKMTLEKIRHIIAKKKELAGIPVLYGLDFGHTTPHFPIPIGGTAEVSCRGKIAKVKFNTF